ncbi:MAG: tol-pal system-associated acyl-CoA thioesterase [Alphaproteobacteria bacterium]|nr:tol-pal system-associated acyl-CoA thioesterase [Alphaproteobacteria bacterium]
MSDSCDPALMLPHWDGQTHKLPIRVYYEDTDAGGIVYHSCYVNFAERGRTEFLRAVGFNQSRLVEEVGVLFAVRSMEIDFKKPARLDDLVVLETRCEKFKGASFIMDQKIYLKDELLIDIKVRIACVSTDLRPCKIPEAIKIAMTDFAANE